MNFFLAISCAQASQGPLDLQYQEQFLDTDRISNSPKLGLRGGNGSQRRSLSDEHNTGCFEDDIGYYGRDLLNSISEDIPQLHADSAAECQLICQGREGCTHFTYQNEWSNPINRIYFKRCFLKTGNEGRYDNELQISGPAFCPAAVVEEPADGVWSEWDEPKCSEFCGDGTLISTRNCINPGGGKPCAGDATKTAEKCNLGNCAAPRSEGAECISSTYCDYTLKCIKKPVGGSWGEAFTCQCPGHNKFFNAETKRCEEQKPHA